MEEVSVAAHEGAVMGGRLETRSRRLDALAVAIVVLAVVAQAGSSLMEFTLPAARGAAYGSALSNFLTGLANLLLAGLGALVVRRRRGNVIGWTLLSAVVVQIAGNVLAAYDIYALQRNLPGGDVVAGIQSYSWMLEVGLLVLFPALLFPDGRLLSRRWRPLAWVSGAAVILGYLGRTFGPTADTYVLPGGHPPKVMSGALSLVLKVFGLGIIVMAACLAAGVVVLILRYRRGDDVVRHQVRWLLVAVVLFVVPFVLHFVLLVATGHDSYLLADLSLLGLTGIPIAAAIAILRYRLYDIDVVISRALVYGALAVIISAVYVGIVVGLGTLVGGGGRPNLALSIAATAVVAVGFQPVRERLQKLANRLVYGRRATPYEVLSEFSSRVAESYGGEEVLPRMARVLAEGTGAERAEVWLRAGAELRRAALWPNGGHGAGNHVLEILGQIAPPIPGADAAVPVRHQGELLGVLAIAKRRGEVLTPIEEKLLDDLANQAGLVLKKARLAAELQASLEDLRASRHRLVKAQDDERRKLERNLHDGAQQNLVAIKVKLGLAELLTQRDPQKARATLGQLKADTDEALETLRDLARGIYPPLLADKGVAAALESQARKATIPVEVVAEAGARYPQDIEAALYFCALEALQNVQKYAGPTRAVVALRAVGDGLVLEVQDDGVGFDVQHQARGSGLTNMQDRIEALGGSLQVTSHPGRGTTVRAELPAPGAGLRPVSLTAGGEVVAG
ncbi:MAG: GAF domain-containing sensor histidine kinase [Candidatus Dormibacteria bacterium]